MSDEPPPAELTTSLETQGDRTVLRVEGEVDLYTAATFEDALAAGLAEGGTLEIDLRGVEFMDSTGLRALLDVRRRADDGQLEGGLTVRMHEDGPVARLLEIAGVAGLFARTDRESPAS